MVASPISNGCPSPEEEGAHIADERFAHWANVVRRVREGDQSGVEELYGVFARSIRYTLARQFGPQDLEDRIHDCFLTVIDAIERGNLREPERLMGFVRTIVRRKSAQFIEGIVANRSRQISLESGLIITDKSFDPEYVAISRQHQEIARKVLMASPTRNREILTRFYLHQQSQEDICHEMHLTDTQFRLLKSRAKAKFAELARKVLKRRQSPPNRTTAVVNPRKTVRTFGR